MVSIENYFFLILLFILAAYSEDIPAGATTETHPVRDFGTHVRVKPKIYHGREKRQITTTKDNGGFHTEHLVIILDIDGEDLTLDLVLNNKLLPKSFFHRVQQDGSHVVKNFSAEEMDHCHYGGKVRGKTKSWVALSTCDGLSGVIYDGEEFHYIEKDTRVIKTSLDTPHFLYKHSDLVVHNKTCGYTGDAHISSPHDHHDNRMLRYKRSTQQEIRGPYNANKESKYVELIIVVDNREYKELGESESKVAHRCKTIANIINGLFSQLNIFVALVGVVIWTEHDEIIFNSDGDKTLSNFLYYRKTKLIKDHPNDNAQLLSKFDFSNGVVGKALKGPICTYEYSGGVNTDHSIVAGLVATTIAHEIGHNFGMEHDSVECVCPDARCIMAPSSSAEAPMHWSSCSLNYLLLAFTHGMDYCLKNKPEFLFDSPVCGNGFVEPGEQCDCGLPEHCDNPCCDVNTCTLHINATCATGACCDLNTCRPKTAGTICRSADYECDLPEYCTGHSEYCPQDMYKMDTESCENGKAYCYHGFCRTRSDQCRLLWGETGNSSNDECYKMNIRGNKSGNCGYNRLNQSFSKCNAENVLCGMLHCKHYNEKLEFGMESVAILTHSFINLNGSIVACRNAIVDLGINQIDPGLAPDGAVCGKDKMCINQRCMPVASLRKDIATCPNGCNGNGWCNNLGHCHCKDGYAPPFCTDAGFGGSEDSGPAKDPNAHKAVVQAFLIIFLGGPSTLAVFALLMYYAKRNNLFVRYKKNPPSMSKSPGKSRGNGTFPESTKRAEDNHSLLHEDSPPPGLQNDFFGNFKGFSLIPAKKQQQPNAEPVRSAPPPPVPPAVPKVPFKKSPIVNRSNTTMSAAKLNFLNKPVARVHSLKPTNNTTATPALPPPNQGSTARPIISSPVLENSTCTAKELISPLRNAPKVPFRPAPEAPKDNRPLSSPEVPHVIVVPTNEQKKVQKEVGGTLNRIASFLKQSDKKPLLTTNTNTLPRNNQVKANKIDKDQLKSLEISGPILQAQIDIPTKVVPSGKEEPKVVIMRAQSMRGGAVTRRPNIPTFGSMRQPNRRPVSIPSGTRPKSPPPRPPPVNETTKGQEYDDCLNKNAPLARLSEENSPVSGDNIYAVIEEPISVIPPNIHSKQNSDVSLNDSLGLLGEIVNEIQNRNFDSIYSTSTLARKKKEQEAKLKEKINQQTYENASVYKSPESVYSNMTSPKSTTSSTSGEYIQPNQPVKLPEEKPSMSTFKADAGHKPYISPYTRPQGPLASTYKNAPITTKTDDKNAPITTKAEDKNASITTKAEEIKKTQPVKSVKFTKQTTPPNIRDRKPSPSRATSTTPKNRAITNSPDLVTSCNTKPNSKPPDVVNGSTLKKPATSAKPVLNGLPKGPAKANKAISFKNVTDKKPVVTKVTKTASDAGVTGRTTPVGLKNASRQNSNVASLQQKFESKSDTSMKSKA